MTLTIEQSPRGNYWLVLLETPTHKGRKLAVFKSREAVDRYRKAWKRSMEFAREVGRSGLG